MLQIPPDEYRTRLETLQTEVQEAGLDPFVVSTLDSLYYLTGAGFEPLERPFFLLVRPRQTPLLLVPKLEHEHMKKARGVEVKNIHSYWEFPAPAGRGWPDQLRGYSFRTEPLIERLRLIKSPAEVAMIRRSAQYADFGVERLIAVSYFGASVAAGFAETRAVTARIIREVNDWEALTTKVVMATWAAPGSAMPHSVPDLSDRLLDGPHVALVLTRVNGYAVEYERTYFTAPPSSKVRKAFSAMMEARRIAFSMIEPNHNPLGGPALSLGQSASI